MDYSWNYSCDSEPEANFQRLSAFFSKRFNSIVYDAIPDLYQIHRSQYQLLGVSWQDYKCFFGSNRLQNRSSTIKQSSASEDKFSENRFWLFIVAKFCWRPSRRSASPADLLNTFICLSVIKSVLTIFIAPYAVWASNSKT